MSIKKQIVVGMSGHIDHGKTSIVKLLTGKNTDNLKQEQERGMTIDLGFAFLNKDITIIDVPGHEKFVKNMMSGSSGIDIAILVVAADDGIMPQTKEHFDILQLLNINSGFVVLNKTDLVDEEWIDLVESDIKQLVKGTFLEDSQIVRTSTLTEKGIDNIKEEILALSLKTPDRNKNGIFRMHIDRVFSKTGFGTVVTGTISSGSVKVGDDLDLIPSFKSVKVRSIQTHGENVESALAGDRAAINLNNIDSNNINRGFHLSKQNTYSETLLIVAKINLIKSDLFKFKNNQRLRVHLGTREVMSRISIIHNSNKGLMILFKLENPLVGAIGDRFIIRTYSPVRTIGGGTIIEIPDNNDWKKIRNINPEVLTFNDEEKLFRIIDNQSTLMPIEFSNIESKLNISLNDFNEILKVDNRYKLISFKSFNWILTKNKIENIKEHIIHCLEDFHENSPLSKGCNKNILAQKTKINDELLSYFLNQLLNDNKINNNSELWSIKGFSLNLSQELEKISNDILLHLNKNNFIDKSNMATLKKGLSDSEFYGVMNYLESDSKIIKISSDLFYSYNTISQIKDKIKIHFKNSDLLTVPQFKDLSQTTRKLAVPLLEYFDKINFTYRFENSRKLTRSYND